MKRVVKSADEPFDPLEGVMEVTEAELRPAVEALSQKWMESGFSIYNMSKTKVELGANMHSRSTMSFDEISEVIEDLKAIQKDIKNFRYIGYKIVG